MNKDFIYNFVTRLVDVFVSSIILILISPFLILIAILLRFTGEGEIFYLQERVGRNKVNFKIIKFATMIKNSPNIGTGSITTPEDPRVLPLGHFLRKTKINELPQLINILIGDMSLVGPRPLMLKQFNFYSSLDQEVVTKMRPGLTGSGSIVFRNEESFFKNGVNPDEVYLNIISPAKGLLETWYFNNKSIKLYLYLVLITAKVVIFRTKTNIKFLDQKTEEKLNAILSRS